MRQQDIPILEAYSEAILQAADQSSVLETAFAEAGEIRQALAATPNLLLFVKRPGIAKEEKKALIQKVLAGRVTPIMLSLPLILVDNNRGALWDDILALFIQHVEERRGVLSATVATAHALSDAEKENLTKSLEQHMGKQLRIAFSEQPSITGGVFFRCEDLMIDSTLSRALENLRQRLHSVRVE